MDMKTYFRRVIKYVIYLTILLGLILLIMDLTKTSKVPMSEVFKTSQSVYFFVVVAIFSLLSPFMSYTKKVLTFDARRNAEEVERVMAMCGYSKVESKDSDIMLFRADSFVKRLSLRFEDTIEINTSSEDISIMKGPRREVVRAAFRMSSFIG